MNTYETSIHNKKLNKINTVGILSSPLPIITLTSIMTTVTFNFGE